MWNIKSVALNLSIVLCVIVMSLSSCVKKPLEVGSAAYADSTTVTISESHVLDKYAIAKIASSLEALGDYYNQVVSNNQTVRAGEWQAFLDLDHYYTEYVVNYSTASESDRTKHQIEFYQALHKLNKLGTFFVLYDPMTGDVYDITKDSK